MGAHRRVRRNLNGSAFFVSPATTRAPSVASRDVLPWTPVSDPTTRTGGALPLCFDCGHPSGDHTFDLFQHTPFRLRDMAAVLTALAIPCQHDGCKCQDFLFDRSHEPYQADRDG